MEDIRDGLAARPADERPLVAVWEVLGGLASAILEPTEEWPLRMEVLRANPTLLPRLWASFATYERALVEGIAARTGTDPDRDLYPALAATVAMSAFRAAMALWRSGKGGRPLADLLDAAFTQVAAGLAPPPSGTSAHGGDPGRPGAAMGNRSTIKSKSARTLPA